MSWPVDRETRQVFVEETAPRIEDELFPENMEFKALLPHILTKLNDSFWDELDDNHQEAAMIRMEHMNEDAQNLSLIDGDPQERFLGHLTDLKLVLDALLMKEGVNYF